MQDESLVSGAADIERRTINELDRRRVVTLAKVGLMLSVMASDGVEIEGYDAARLYAETMMALGVEDCDEGTEDIALEIARDHPEGCLLGERFLALPTPPIEVTADQREAIARIVDPEGWQNRQHYAITCWRLRRKESLTKATAILNLLADKGGETWPSDATFQEGWTVSTRRKPFFRGRVAGWYRNSDGRLGYAVENVDVPGLIHVYPEAALDQATAPTPEADMVLVPRSVVEPFVEFAANNTDAEGWAGTSCQGDRIRDWFGPSEFRALRSAVEGVK